MRTRIATYVRYAGRIAHPAPDANLTASILLACGIGLAIHLASLVGIASRPVDALAMFWPANALFLGLMVRIPRARNVLTFVAAFIGYCAADMLTGSTFRDTAWLSIANLVGVGTGLALVCTILPDAVTLDRSGAIVKLSVVSAASALSAAIIGGTTTYALDGGDMLLSVVYWFSSELGNYLLLLPALLTLPAPREWRRRLVNTMGQLRPIIPGLATFVASIAAMFLIGGPGSMVYPLPALLWLAYGAPIPTLAVLVALSGMTSMISNSHALLHTSSSEGMTPDLVVSLRLGVAMMSIAVLALANSEQRRRLTMEHLRHSAYRDELTGLANRRAFMADAATLLERTQLTQPVAVLMIDIDRFKSINDTYGHSTGDLILRQLAIAIEDLQSHVPASANGRLGGEEFAVLLAGVEPDAVQRHAAAFLTRMSDSARILNGVTSTASIGIAFASTGDSESLEELLKIADTQMYIAKRQGGNQVVADKVGSPLQIPAINALLF